MLLAALSAVSFVFSVWHARLADVIAASGNASRRGLTCALDDLARDPGVLVDLVDGAEPVVAVGHDDLAVLLVAHEQ